MLAGGTGGLIGDMMMHSLDTVKTRQQGDPHFPPKYANLRLSYWQILREEGVLRGLYGGVVPAFLGSFLGTSIFFGSYEWSKRRMIDMGISPWIAYLSAGLAADLAASPIYVPTEVLKTRLQLQGKYNNPYFHSGFNYRSTLHAINSIVKYEGMGALFYGYKATLYRDVPFSALQFFFYEQEQKLAKSLVGSPEIGITLEILTGATAGCAAGVITCPLDVVKTRIQTQLNPNAKPMPITATSSSSTSKHSSTQSTTRQIPPNRHISTSSPSTTLKTHATPPLDTSSVLKGLQIMYRSEGIPGLFRGVGPRAVWTGVQSGCMFLLYQTFLKWFDGPTPAI
jgi:hypothetical protein